MVCVCSMLVGCASGGSGLRPARISHVVLFSLKDPADRAELLADCDENMPRIAGVVAYAGGRPLDVGREMVDGDYNVGLYIGFKTEAAYAAYLDNERHLSLVEKWKSRIAEMRVFDVLDETE